MKIMNPISVFSCGVGNRASTTIRSMVVMSGLDARSKWINSLNKELYHVDQTRIHRNALWL